MTITELGQAVASRTVLAESQKEHFPYTIETSGLTIAVYDKVFSPKHFHGWEFFNKHLPLVLGERVLEIGTGTGVTSLYLAKQGARKVVAVDINPHAVKNARHNAKLNNLENVEVRQSDIYSGIHKNERFNTIYWNTPFIYMSGSYKYSSVLERGLFDPGYRITEQFLKEGKRHLLPGGRILFGTGDFGDIGRFKGIAKRNRYKIQLIASGDSKEINPVVFELYELKPS